ncbi:peptidylprolyl isomerase [Maribacter sp. HTCC2170]|uniref:peptidylprolyl isomerase n=1 Tax=Maribacter sp. (strain HTCC2170 / KCCM 42371) TaxID=313603 RepID=UPI00006B1B30|nr:peptidylprolyl isomerase [Maribacter sp. HTCC2170]EAR00872.1 peptidyl-prolyl cis-trans isomerase A [Maribacter sp. HTCC2170]
MIKKYKLIVFLIVLMIGCSPKTFNIKWTKEIAPQSFTTRFETSKGNFEILVDRRFSPKAADRFYQLVRHKFFDNSLFYRVNPGFVAQFGGNDSIVYKKWNSVKVPDEDVKQGNTKGYLSFARSGKGTRTSDLFINLGNNSRLDTIFYNEVKGFPSFGKVTKGMEVVEKLYSGYGDKTMEHFEEMLNNREAFLKKYPELDVINKAYLVD